MLQPVGVGHKSLADYTHLAGRQLVEDIREMAEELRGLKVLHLSATAFGGGVSEILYTLVPLMRDAGIDADWQIIGRSTSTPNWSQTNAASSGDRAMFFGESGSIAGGTM